MQERLEKALAEIRPKLGGTDVSITGADQGMVKLKVFASSCGPGMSKDMAIELLEDYLKQQVPEVKEVVAE